MEAFIKIAIFLLLIFAAFVLFYKIGSARHHRKNEEEKRQSIELHNLLEKVHQEIVERTKPQYLHSGILGGDIVLYDATIRMPDFNDSCYRDDERIVQTKRGEKVRSKQEAMIADFLYDNDIPYQYEPVLCLRHNDGPDVTGTVLRRPDFAIVNPPGNEIWLWEHCGMLTDEEYKEKWEEKKKLYSKHQIKEGENLIVTDETIDREKLRFAVFHAFGY